MGPEAPILHRTAGSHRQTRNIKRRTVDHARAHEGSSVGGSEPVKMRKVSKPSYLDHRAAGGLGEHILAVVGTPGVPTADGRKREQAEKIRGKR